MWAFRLPKGGGTRVERFDFPVEAKDEGRKLEHFLRDRGFSRRCITSLKHTYGAMQIDGVHARTIDRVHAGSRVTVLFPEDHNEAVPCEDRRVPVVYEDASVIVYDKPPGMATHQTLRHPVGTLANVFAADMKREGIDRTFRVLNRLDRDTSGLVVVAKDAHAAAVLTESRVQKVYYAVASGRIEGGGGTIDAPIARLHEGTTERCVRADGQRAVTHYRVLARDAEATFLEVRLETGRTHQIRVHLRSIGHVLLGDDMYGGSRARIGRQALHCGQVCFRHPESGRTVALTAPLPEDMQAILPVGVNLKELLQNTAQNRPDAGEDGVKDGWRRAEENDRV